MLVHRYAGIALGLLMLLWFASGVVMLFVRWPEVHDDQRAAGQPAIVWTGCCRFGDAANGKPVERAVVEDRAGRPVLRADGQVIDLATGAPVTQVSTREATRVAAAYAHGNGIAGRPGSPRVITRDQWTVVGGLDKRRPFWTFRFDDPRHTDVYVSARTGQVAQVTDGPGRVLAWLGPIPHWLYPAILRQDGKLWTQVVVWTSLAGTFLTLTGLYLGIVAWRPWRDRRVTPYRGLMAWHHIAGLLDGMLTLTWVASGLVSMNPWGLLESGPDAQSQRLTGEITFGDMKAAVAAAAQANVTARQLRAAPFEGRLYLMADGARLDAAGRPAPLSPQTLATAAKRLGPIDRAETITREDAYYFGHHEAVTLPAYRVELKGGVRFYLDPASGQVLSRVDRNDKGYRWLHEGLHRLDFIRGFDRGAAWAAAMVALLVYAGVGVATGVWLGFRRAGADLSRRAKTKAPKPG